MSKLLQVDCSGSLDEDDIPFDLFVESIVIAVLPKAVFVQVHAAGVRFVVRHEDTDDVLDWPASGPLRQRSNTAYTCLQVARLLLRVPMAPPCFSQW